MKDNVDSAGRYNPTSLRKLKTVSQGRMINSAADTIIAATLEHKSRLRTLHAAQPEVAPGDERYKHVAKKTINIKKAVGSMLPGASGQKLLHDVSAVDMKNVRHRAEYSKLYKNTPDLPSTSTVAEYKTLSRKAARGVTVINRANRLLERADQIDAITAHAARLKEMEAQRVIKAERKRIAAENAQIKERRRQLAELAKKTAAEKKAAEAAAKKAKIKAYKAAEALKEAKIAEAKNVGKASMKKAEEQVANAVKEAAETAATNVKGKLSKGKLAAIGGGVLAAGAFGRYMYNRSKAKKA